MNGKRRIRKNVWDNWYGYEGTKRTQAFAESVEFSAEQDANHWLETGERFLNNCGVGRKDRNAFNYRRVK